MGYLTPELLETFVQHGADVNARDALGRTALIEIVSEKNNLTKELLKLFIVHGADVNVQDNLGRTALMESAWHGYLDLKLFEIFARSGGINLVNMQDMHGYTALMQLSQNGSFVTALSSELLGAFIREGADINQRDRDGNTALMWAAGNGHLTPELLDSFIRERADINIQNKEGMTALALSAHYRRLTPELVKAYVRNGANINERDKSGRTALMWSALNDPHVYKVTELYEALTAHRTDKKDDNYDNYLSPLPLMLSTEEVYDITPKLIDVFVKNGADINVRDEEGKTALMYLAREGYLTLPMLEVFINNGVDINAQNEDGKTALILLADKGFLSCELLDLFVNHGADINLRDDYGFSALDFTALKYDSEFPFPQELLEKFVKYGADISKIIIEEDLFQSLVDILPDNVAYCIKGTIEHSGLKNFLADNDIYPSDIKQAELWLKGNIIAPGGVNDSYQQKERREIGAKLFIKNVYDDPKIAEDIINQIKDEARKSKAGDSRDCEMHYIIDF